MMLSVFSLHYKYIDETKNLILPKIDSYVKQQIGNFALVYHAWISYNVGVTPLGTCQKFIILT